MLRNNAGPTGESRSLPNIALTEDALQDQFRRLLSLSGKTFIHPNPPPKTKSPEPEEEEMAKDKFFDQSMPPTSPPGLARVMLGFRGYTKCTSQLVSILHPSSDFSRDILLPALDESRQVAQAIAKIDEDRLVVACSVTPTTIDDESHSAIHKGWRELGRFPDVSHPQASFHVPRCGPSSERTQLETIFGFTAHHTLYNIYIYMTVSCYQEQPAVPLLTVV